MSILIKGIEMPKASNDDMVVIIRHDGNAEVWQSGKKETKTQAVQIPPQVVRWKRNKDDVADFSK